MKNKEKLAEEYLKTVYMNNPYKLVDKSFIEGWNSAEERLEQIAKQLQKEDITSVVYALREVIKRMKE